MCLSKIINLPFFYFFLPSSDNGIQEDHKLFLCLLCDEDVDWHAQWYWHSMHLHCLCGNIILAQTIIHSKFWIRFFLSFFLQADCMSEENRASAIATLAGVGSAAFLCSNFVVRFLSTAQIFLVCFTLIWLFCSYVSICYSWVVVICYWNEGVINFFISCAIIHDNIPKGQH